MDANVNDGVENCGFGGFTMWMSWGHCPRDCGFDPPGTAMGEIACQKKKKATKKQQKKSNLLKACPRKWVGTPLAMGICSGKAPLAMCVPRIVLNDFLHF